MRDARRWLAAAVTLLVTGLQLRLLVCAGGLWRDEVNTLNTATSPSLAALWRGLEYESAPLLWPLLLRGWCALGLGDADLGLRVLGLLGALSLPLAGWWVARRLGLAAPLLLLLLVALNPEVLRWSASLRAFGLGSALLLLVFEALYRMSVAPARGNLAWALLVTLLCVHSLYYNAVFVLAICVGAAALCVAQGRSRRILPVVSIGAVAALSLLPYVATLQAQYLGAEGFQAPRLWWKLEGALVAQHALLPRLWLVLLVMAALAFAARWRRGAQRDLALYAGVVGLSAALLFPLFLVSLGYATQSWYYVGLLALGALALDLLLEPALRGPRGRGLQLAFALLLVALSLPSAWRESGTRFSNVDVLAQRIESLARPGDFVVVQPWFLAIPYERYRGAALPWAQLPPLEDARVHRWDLLAERIARPDPIASVLDRVGATLQRGGRVFVLRLFPPLPRGARARQLPPAADGVKSAALYDAAWSTQLDVFLREHAARLARLPPDAAQPVSVFERAWLQIAYGRLD